MRVGDIQSKNRQVRRTCMPAFLALGVAKLTLGGCPYVVVNSILGRGGL